MNQHRLAIGLLVLATASSGIVVACSSDDSTPAGGTTTPGKNRISAAAGGTVSDPSGNTSLTIPPGALAQDTDITLAILPKSGNAVVEISDFGPDGLTFLKPATLSIKADAALAPAGESLALAIKEGAEFKEIPGSTYANGAATGPVSHFTSFSVLLKSGAPVVDGGSDSGDSGGGAVMIDDGSYTWGIWTCSTPAKTTDIKAYAISIGIESVDTTIAGLTGTVYSNYSGTPACARITDYTNAYSSTGMVTATTSANYTCSATCAAQKCTAGTQAVTVNTYALMKNGTTFTQTRVLDAALLTASLPGLAGCQAGDLEAASIVKK